ncbi:MAG: hypothetical protein JNL21_27585 [Myxococcales bacterium]|nr:hypothetical protein [Myxococcales bacterium]
MPGPNGKKGFSRLDLLEVAVAAKRDERTVASYLRNESVRQQSALDIIEALHRLGYIDDENRDQRIAAIPRALTLESGAKSTDA